MIGSIGEDVLVCIGIRKFVVVKLICVELKVLKWVFYEVLFIIVGGFLVGMMDYDFNVDDVFVVLVWFWFKVIFEFFKNVLIDVYGGEWGYVFFGSMCEFIG